MSGAGSRLVRSCGQLVELSRRSYACAVDASSESEPITVRVPRSIASVLPSLSDDLTNRMHELLERNTEGQLNPIERAELETLVQMAQVAQILAMMVRSPDPV